MCVYITCVSPGICLFLGGSCPVSCLILIYIQAAYSFLSYVFSSCCCVYLFTYAYFTAVILLLILILQPLSFYLFLYYSHGLRTAICEASKFVLVYLAPTLPDIQVWVYHKFIWSSMPGLFSQLALLKCVNRH